VRQDLLDRYAIEEHRVLASAASCLRVARKLIV
jgi:hypothetical protein